MITIVEDFGGDWVAIYNDDVLMIENHSLHPHEILEAAGVKFERREVDVESLPTDLKDL